MGDLDLAIQAKLLRVLQERELTRVGAQDAIEVDVRIVAATNRDLEALVREGRFRDDLYYRLNVIPIRLAAAPRARRPISRRCSSTSCARSRAATAGPRPSRLRTSWPRRSAYPWPGNVRELRNLCERAVLMGWAAVAPILGAARPKEPIAAAALVDTSLPLLEARQRARRALRARVPDAPAARAPRAQVGEVARAAGIAERNLYEKMKAYGLCRDDYR